MLPQGFFNHIVLNAQMSKKLSKQVYKIATAEQANISNVLSFFL